MKDPNTPYDIATTMLYLFPVIELYLSQNEHE